MAKRAAMENPCTGFEQVRNIANRPSLSPTRDSSPYLLQRDFLAFSDRRGSALFIRGSTPVQRCRLVWPNGSNEWTQARRGAYSVWLFPLSRGESHLSEEHSIAARDPAYDRCRPHFAEHDIFQSFPALGSQLLEVLLDRRYTRDSSKLEGLTKLSKW